MLSRFGFRIPSDIQKERASLREEGHAIRTVVEGALQKGAEHWTTGDILRVGLGTWRLSHIRERLQEISVWWK